VVFRPLVITTLSFLLLGGVALLSSLSLPLGSPSRPGAGFYPLFVSFVLVGLSLGLLRRSVKKVQEEETESFPDGKDRNRVIHVASALILFGVFLKPVGYEVSSAILMGAVLHLLGMRSWAKIFFVSILTSAVSFYLFVCILGVPLPRGIF
jgi:hypothetical protein